MNFIVICSNTALPAIEELFTAKEVTTPAKWAAVEKKLSTESKNKLNEKAEKPFTMAGNVRGASNDFLAGLPLFSAQGSLLRKYEIEVKK